MGDSSPAARAALTKGARSADLCQRQAAAVSIARLKLQPLPPGAREAIVETLSSAESDDFRHLPWDAANSTDDYETKLRTCLGKQDRAALAASLTASVDSGRASDAQAEKLVELLFPPRRKGSTGRLTTQDLSPIQARAAAALVRWMEGGRRLPVRFESARGVPGNFREWRTLATGIEPPPAGMSLPLFGRADDPKKPLQLNCLKVGQRVHHREGGYGVVAIVEEEGRAYLCIKLGEVGPLWFPRR